MNEMTLLSLKLSIIVIFCYYVFTILEKFHNKNGGSALGSISESHLRYMEQNKPFPFLLFCWSIGILMIIIGFGQLEINGNGSWPMLYVLSGAGMMLCGTAGLYSKRNIKTAHYLGASVAIFFGLSAVWLIHDHYILVASAMGIVIIWEAIILFLPKLAAKTYGTGMIYSRLLYYEILAFAVIMTGMLI